MSRQTTIQSRQTRVAPQDSDPAFWTDERAAVMDVLFRRSEFSVRTQSMTVETKKGSRWRPFTASRTKHLFEQNDPVLTSKNVGPAIKALIDWGYIERISTSVAKVEFTPKGWAWLAFRKKFDPAWFDVLFEKEPDRDIVWGMYRKFKSGEKLRSLSTQFASGLTAQAEREIMENDIMAEMPFTPAETEDELPGLPEFDEGTEQGIQSRVTDADFVQRTTLQLARTFHHGTIGALSKIEPKKVAEAIGKHLTPEEVIRGDLEMIRDQRAGPRESYYSRLLVDRMSAAGDFKARSLADHTQGGLAGVHGQDRIAEALIAQELRDAGLARHMPGTTTLGDVQDRLERESVSEMAQDDELSIPDPHTIMDAGKPYRRDEAIADVISHGEDFRTALTAMRDNAAPATEDSDDVGYWQHQLNVLDRILLAFDIASEPVPATPENIAEANRAWTAEDDALPMVDWIDRRLGQYDYDGWIPNGNAAMVAREAVFRHMRENPSGAQIIGDGNITQYDGFRLHVRRNITALDGRAARLALTIDSDYDQQDTANIEAWFERLAEQKPGRSYTYPDGANVSHQAMGELEDIQVRSINPLWMVAMMFGSSFMALIMFLIFLNILPVQP